MKIYNCELCGTKVAEIENGSKIKIGACFLCSTCYEKMKIAHDIAQQARESTPEFLKDLFGGFGH